MAHALVAVVAGVYRVVAAHVDDAENDGGSCYCWPHGPVPLLVGDDDDVREDAHGDDDDDGTTDSAHGYDHCCYYYCCCSQTHDDGVVGGDVDDEGDS